MFRQYVAIGVGEDLAFVDYLSIGVYLLSLLLVTFYVNRTVGGADSEHYFLGGRDLPFWAIGLSLFASNLGTDHLVGLAGSGAKQGLAVGMYEWSSCYVLLVLGWVFVPHYLAHNIFTVPEYLEQRFDKGLRTFFTWLTIIATVLTKISVTIFAGAVVLQAVLGWNMWIASTALLTLTGLYTTVGGLAAVVYTEVLQSVVLLVGSSALLWYGMSDIGGWSGLKAALPADYFQLLKPADHPDYPWPGVVFGLTINSIWYWCTDQVMVQRVLAAKNVSVGQSACVVAGWLKITPMFIMVLPGLIAAALYPDDISKDSNQAFALLVTRLLPAGWRGPMIAVMLSSFMAALASCFNSCSTLFTMDVYAKRYPDHSEADLVRVGRYFTVFLAVVSLAWLPVIKSANKQLFLYIQGMQVVWCSPVATIFIASILMPKLSASTARTSLFAGLCLGAAFWMYQNALPQSLQHPAIGAFNILNYAIISFLFTFLVVGCLHHQELSSGSEVERLALLKKAEQEKGIVEQEEWAGMPTKAMAVSLVVCVTGLIVGLSI